MHKTDITKALGLSDVVMAALCNNPQTKIAWQTSLYQAAQVGVSQSAYLPTLSATGSVLKSESSEIKTGNQEKYRGNTLICCMILVNVMQHMTMQRHF